MGQQVPTEHQNQKYLGIPSTFSNKSNTKNQNQQIEKEDLHLKGHFIKKGKIGKEI